MLVHNGWRYYVGYREREQQTAALAVELVQARLDALRMQLNPHFLFNTLNAISALIHANPQRADRMVVRLSELLRRTLTQTESHEVALREELALLDGYLEIERTRFEDHLAVELRIEPGLEDALVPALILQPLVENAVRHGIEAREETGHVEVVARRVEGKLEISVKDDGPGLPDKEHQPRKEGIGLTNTRARLAHLYGSTHCFGLSSVPGGGLEVRIQIPYRTTPQVLSPPQAVVAVGQPCCTPAPTGAERS